VPGGSIDKLRSVLLPAVPLSMVGLPIAILSSSIQGGLGVTFAATVASRSSAAAQVTQQPTWRLRKGECYDVNTYKDDGER
jgi:hypothetical protein